MHVPSLSIIIITLNEEGRLPLLLEDLKKQSWTDFEVIHVDSRSEDKTIQLSQTYASTFESYRIIEMRQRGVSLGRNVGASAASGKRLLFLDADTRLSVNFLKRTIGELEAANADVGVVQMSADGLSLRYKFGFAAFNLGLKLTSHFFPTAIGACLFSTKEVHQQIGGFDEEISLCEDCNYVLESKRKSSASIRILREPFRFDPRRLEQDGFFTTGFVYLRANLRRFFKGELRSNEIRYEFGHYTS